jgi:hypothetical protein
MGKFLVRVTIILTTVLFLLTYIFALNGYNVATSTYVILFEVCVVVYCYSEGRYHCRFMKYTALAITIADSLSRLDRYVDFLPATLASLISITIIAIGILVSVTKALIHFYRVKRIKRWKSQQLDGRQSD